MNPDKSIKLSASRTDKPDTPRRRGAGIYFAASATAQVCALMRYTFLARLLGPEQLGLAATLVLTAQFFESLTESGSDRLLIQDEDGGSEGAQKLVQLVFVSRGAFTTVALIALAAPIALATHSSQLAAGFCLLALSPLIAGFLHLDMRRDQRDHDFRSEAWGLLASELAGILTTVAACLLFRSFTAVALGFIARSIAIVAISHARSHRKYELGISSSFLPKLKRFAFPLMINGLLLFAAGQGDRVLIGQQLGLKELGYYSATILLIFYPSTMIVRFLSTIYLPQIAHAGTENGQRNQRARLFLGTLTVLAATMTIGFSIVGSPATRILYGARFALSDMTVTLVGVLQMVRFMRAFPVVTAMAIGQSRIVLAGTAVSLVGWPLAIAASAFIGDGLTGFVAGFIAGEVVALCLTTVLTTRSRGTAAFSEMLSLLRFFAFCGLMIAWRAHLPGGAATTAILALAGLGLTGWLAVAEISAITSLARIVLDTVRPLTSRLLRPSPPVGQA